MRKFLAAALAALLSLAPLPAVRAQGWPNNFVYATLVKQADVTTGAYTYFVFGDRNALVTTVPITGVMGPGTAVNFKAKTVGSSTTVTTNTASLEPFRGLAVGDLLIFPQVVAGGDVETTIATFTDSSNIVTADAVDLTGGFTFRFKKKLTTTGSATAGWFDVSGFDHFNVQAQVDTLNATSLTFTLECRASKYAAANTLYEQTITSASAPNNTGAIAVSTHQEQCRVGWKIAGDAGVQSVSTFFTGAK